MADTAQEVPCDAVGFAMQRNGAQQVLFRCGDSKPQAARGLFELLGSPSDIPVGSCVAVSDRYGFVVTTTPTGAAIYSQQHLDKVAIAHKGGSVLELCEVDPIPMATLEFSVEGPARGLAISSEGGMLAVAQGAGLHVFSLGRLLESGATTLQPVYTVDIAPAALLSFQWSYNSDSQPAVPSPMLLTLELSGQLHIFGIHSSSPLSSLSIPEAVTAAWTVDNSVVLMGKKDSSIQAIHVDSVGIASATVPADCTSAFFSWKVPVPESAVGWECFFVFPFREDEIAVAWRCSDIHDFPPTCFSIFRRLADRSWRHSFLDCVCPPPDSEDLTNALDLSRQRYFAQYIPALDILLVGSTMGTWVDIIGRATGASLKPVATDSIGMYLYNQENDRRKLSLVECADPMAAGSSLCFGIGLSTTSQHSWDASHVQAPAGTPVPSLPLLFTMSSSGILCSHGLFSPLKQLPARSATTSAVIYTLGPASAPSAALAPKVSPVVTTALAPSNALASPRPGTGLSKPAAASPFAAATQASRSSTFPHATAATNSTTFPASTKSLQATTTGFATPAAPFGKQTIGAFPTSNTTPQASTTEFATPATLFPKPSASAFPTSSGGFAGASGVRPSVPVPSASGIPPFPKDDNVPAPANEPRTHLFTTSQAFTSEPSSVAAFSSTQAFTAAKAPQQPAESALAARAAPATQAMSSVPGSDAFVPVLTGPAKHAARELPAVRGLPTTKNSINARFQEIVSRVDKMFELTAQSSLQFPSEKEQKDIQENIQWLATARIGDIRHNALQLASNVAGLQDVSTRLLETMEVHVGSSIARARHDMASRQDLLRTLSSSAVDARRLAEAHESRPLDPYSENCRQSTSRRMAQLRHEVALQTRAVQELLRRRDKLQHSVATPAQQAATLLQTSNKLLAAAADIRQLVVRSQQSLQESRAQQGLAVHPMGIISSPAQPRRLGLPSAMSGVGKVDSWFAQKGSRLATDVLSPSQRLGGSLAHTNIRMPQSQHSKPVGVSLDHANTFGVSAWASRTLQRDESQVDTVAQAAAALWKNNTLYFEQFQPATSIPVKQTAALPLKEAEVEQLVPVRVQAEKKVEDMPVPSLSQQQLTPATIVPAPTPQPAPAGLTQTVTSTLFPIGSLPPPKTPAPLPAATSTSTIPPKKDAQQSFGRAFSATAPSDDGTSSKLGENAPAASTSAPRASAIAKHEDENRKSVTAASDQHQLKHQDESEAEAFLQAASDRPDPPMSKRLHSSHATADLHGLDSPAETPPQPRTVGQEEHLAALERYYAKHNPAKQQEVPALFAKRGDQIWTALEGKFPGTTAEFVPQGFVAQGSPAKALVPATPEKIPQAAMPAVPSASKPFAQSTPSSPFVKQAIQPSSSTGPAASTPAPAFAKPPAPFGGLAANAAKKSTSLSAGAATPFGGAAASQKPLGAQSPFMAPQVAAETTPSDQKQRLAAFYRDVNPDKATTDEFLDGVLQKHGTGIWDSLAKKYGAEIVAPYRPVAAATIASSFGAGKPGFPPSSSPAPSPFGGAAKSTFASPFGAAPASSSPFTTPHSSPFGKAPAATTPSPFVTGNTKAPSKPFGASFAPASSGGPLSFGSVVPKAAWGTK